MWPLLVALACRPADVVDDDDGLVVRFVAHDAAGTALAYDDALDLMEARGAYIYGEPGWRLDALLDTETLTTLAYAPLSRTEDATFEVRSDRRNVSLLLPWLTPARGYEVFVLEGDGDGYVTGGTRVLEVEIAATLGRRLDEAEAARPDFVPDGEYRSLRTTGDAALAAIDPDDATSEQAIYAATAIDAYTLAWDSLLRGHGRAVGSEQARWWGVSLDRSVEDRDAVDDSVVRLFGEDGWVRLGATLARPASGAADESERLRGEGVSTIGQFLDDDVVAAVDDAEWAAIVDAALAAVEADAWEVAHGANAPHTLAGDADPYARGARVTDTLDRVEAAEPNALTVLTLRWTAGAPAPFGVFDWVDDVLDPADRDRIDVVLLQIFPDDAPMGSSTFDRVMGALAARFPNARVGVGEVDYWNTSRVWWWGDVHQVTDRTREDVWRLYTEGSFGGDAAIGGGFLGSYERTAFVNWGGNPTWLAMRASYEAVRGDAR